MLQVNDKIKYVNENGAMGIPLDTVLTVKEIQGTALRVEGSCFMHGMECAIQGVMSYDEVAKNFVKAVEEQKPTWTEWRVITSNEMYNIKKSLDYSYVIIDWLTDYLKKTNCTLETRNNGKKTDVRMTFLDDNITKATSTCNTTANDKFDETKGIAVALIKLFAKRVAQFSKIYIQDNY